MYQTLLLLFSFIGCSLNVIGQQLPPVTDTADNKTFYKVEIESSFPGGMEAWTQYLKKNLNANVPAKRKAPAGTYMVIVRFIVAKDGSISNIEAETKHGYGMEEEVIRIIKKGPSWNPAQQGGRFVNAYRRQPVTFVVRGR